MPLLETIGSASAKGFGLTSNSGGSIVFNTPGVYTWTSPTALVKTLTGTGGSGRVSAGVGFYRNDSAYGGLFRRTGTVSFTTSMPTSGSVPYNGNVDSQLTNLEVSYDGGSTWSPATAGYYASSGIFSQTTTSGSYQGSSLDYSTVRSVASSACSSWNSTVTTASSGTNVPYSPGIILPQYFYFDGNESGGNSFALGQTFLAGTGNTAPTTTTFTNLTTSIGSTYVIEVGTNLGAAVSKVIITW